MTYDLDTNLDFNNYDEISEESIKGVIKKGFALLMDLIVRVLHKLDEIKRNRWINSAVHNIYSKTSDMTEDERFDYLARVGAHRAKYYAADKNNPETAANIITDISWSLIDYFTKESSLKHLTTLYSAIKDKDYSTFHDGYIRDVGWKLDKIINFADKNDGEKYTSGSLPWSTQDTMVKCLKMWFNCISLLLRKTLRFYRSNKDTWTMTKEQKEVLKTMNVLYRDSHNTMYALQYFGNVK